METLARWTLIAQVGSANCEDTPFLAADIRGKPSCRRGARAVYSALRNLSDLKL
jgi:hypothetical protein